MSAPVAGNGQREGVTAMDAWFTVSSTLVGLIVGGAATFLTTRAQLRIEAEHAYDRALRDLRLSHYQELFHLTEALPREWGHLARQTGSTWWRPGSASMAGSSAR